VGWSATAWVHPFDEAATARLTAFDLPVLDPPALTRTPVGTAVAAGELSALVGKVASAFGLPEPELRLAESGRHAYGSNLIVLPETAPCDLEPDELEALVAHECGHLALGHARYAALLDRVDPDSPLGAAVREWSDAAELSADRAAALHTGGPDAITRVIFKVHSVPFAPVRIREIQAWTATSGYRRLWSIDRSHIAAPRTPAVHGDGLTSGT
jgi:hypothetical protein